MLSLRQSIFRLDGGVDLFFFVVYRHPLEAMDMIDSDFTPLLESLCRVTEGIDWHRKKGKLLRTAPLPLIMCGIEV